MRRFFWAAISAFHSRFFAPLRCAKRAPFKSGCNITPQKFRAKTIKNLISTTSRKCKDIQLKKTQQTSAEPNYSLILKAKSNNYDKKITLNIINMFCTVALRSKSAGKCNAGESISTQHHRVFCAS